MTLGKRIYWIFGLVALVVIAGVSLTIAAGTASSQSAPGQIDDGIELLDQASITLEAAVAAAQSSAEGALGEVDLEFYQGQLVFNVDVGDKDVKVDAANGAVLGWESDDHGDDEDD